MPNQTLIISTLFAIVVFTTCNLLIFRFADKFMLVHRFKLGGRVLASILNTLCLILSMLLPVSTSFFTYIILYIMFFLEFSVLYKDGYLKSFCVSSAYLLFIMAIRSVCVPMYSMLTGIPFFNVVNNLVYLTLTTTITFIVLSVFVIMISSKSVLTQIKNMNRYKEQIKFLSIFMIPMNVYLIITSRVYSSDSNYKFINQWQMFVGVLIIATVFLVYSFSVKSSSLLGYKDKISELQAAISKEKQFKNTVTGDAIATYEINITNNRFTTEFTKTIKPDGINFSDYDASIAIIAEKYVHPDDYDGFVNLVSTSNLLNEYANGKTELSNDYRRFVSTINGVKTYIWVKCVIYLISDRESSDIKALAYVKDIDQAKRIQLELEYKAERDSLTGLYNKGMTIKQINERFSALKKDEQCAILIIDVDNFKLVNDNLGHVFGDAVLCELSQRLLHMFTARDIVGRIGGDEFLVFINNASDKQQIINKANDILVQFNKLFTTKQVDVAFKISASIGIATFPHDGECYDDLFLAADISLYTSKKNGKNTYTFYQGEEFSGYHSNRTEIDTGILPQKSFKSNRMEYVFKILYGSENPYSAIQTVLELLTHHFEFSRGYIFEINDQNTLASNTFEWCIDEAKHQLNTLQNIPIQNMSSAISAFENSGVFIVQEIAELPQLEQDILLPQGIKSMLQFGHYDNGRLRGFVGFDDCIATHIASDVEIDEMSIICNMLLTFLFKQRAIERTNEGLQILQNVMNNVNSFAYVVNPETFELIFMNVNTYGIATNAKIGDKCYNAFRGFDEQCDDCPIREIDNKIGSYIIKEMNNKMLDIWLQVTTSNIEWINGAPACLVSNMNITKYITSK